MVEDVNKRNRVMKSIHNSSHFGINRTLDLVSSKYYWPGLTNDVKQYLSTTCMHALTIHIYSMCLYMYVSCACPKGLIIISLFFFRFAPMIYVKETITSCRRLRGL